MGILQLPFPYVGQSGLKPDKRPLATTDNLATITTAGYLNALNLEGFPLNSYSVLEVLYDYNVQTQSGTYGVFTVSITNGVITLVEDLSGGNVLMPVVSGNFAVFNGTTGQIKDAGYLPSNAAKTVVPMMNAAVTVGHLAQFADTAGTLVGGILATNVVRKDTTNAMAAGSSIVLAKVSAAEAANAVTASGVAGIITTSALTTAGGANYAITWTNTFISTTSVILLSLMGGTNTIKNITMQATAGAGTSTLTIYNNTAATALNGTILIGYAVL